MGVDIEFAIGYAIGFCIVGAIVFLRYEKKLDRMRQANVNLILDKMSVMSDANDKESGTYNEEGTRSDVKDAVKYAMKKSHPDNGGSADDFRKFRKLYEEMEGK